MPATAVIGLQWGDEAKGKIVDILCENADLVARFNGGDNAGHTVVNQYGTFKLRLTPNGFYNPNTTCVIGPGVVVNLNTLLEEIDRIQESGLQLEGRLWISPRCHVVMPYHPMMESIFESAKGSSRTGTTRRGMGPVYADKVSYNGIRLFDLADNSIFAQKLKIQLAIKNPIFEAFQLEPLDFEAVYQEKLDQFSRIRSWVKEPFGLIQDLLTNQGQIVLEGAQGALLDNNWGTYPFCTASITLAGGAPAGLGVAPHWIKEVIGVAKAYTTRVGGGPMPTELHDDVGELIQNEGQEFGTVTGRPRRCGWFDAALVRFTSQLNGVTSLALTKLDVLDKLPVLKICTGYRHPRTGEHIGQYWEGDAHWLEGCQPVYIEMPGWQAPTSSARNFNQLPSNAQSYIQKIEELVSTPVNYISVGPERAATITLNN
jgi:adenylosuccinate synthase